MWGMGALLYLLANHFFPNLIFQILGYLCLLITLVYLFRFLKEKAEEKQKGKAKGDAGLKKQASIQARMKK